MAAFALAIGPMLLCLACFYAIDRPVRGLKTISSAHVLLLHLNHRCGVLYTNASFGGDLRHPRLPFPLVSSHELRQCSYQ